MRYLNVINNLTNIVFSIFMFLRVIFLLGCFMYQPQMLIGHMALPLGFHLDVVEFCVFVLLSVFNLIS